MGRGNGTTVHVSSEIRIEPAMDGAESKAQSETAETKEPAVDKESANHGKAIIHNLIIVDESGSMSHLKNATILGVNETIKTIRNAQTEFAATQEHMLTLVTFDSNSFKPAVRTIIDDMPVLEVAEFCDYAPNGCTPLYDALGQSLTALYNKIKDNKDATAVVTVLTDGFENASR